MYDPKGLRDSATGKGSLCFEMQDHELAISTRESTSTVSEADVGECSKAFQITGRPFGTLRETILAMKDGWRVTDFDLRRSIRFVLYCLL